MIEAIIKMTGAMIDKPVFKKIIIEKEDDIAVRRKNEETEKIEQLTIAQLFDSFLKKSNYIKTGDEVDYTLFESWFLQKFIKGKNIESRIISIEYKRV
jgi:hypothetical protein